jgi:hypothetical protein
MLLISERNPLIKIWTAMLAGQQPFVNHCTITSKKQYFFSILFITRQPAARRDRHLQSHYSSTTCFFTTTSFSATTAGTYSQERKQCRWRKHYQQGPRKGVCVLAPSLIEAGPTPARAKCMGYHQRCKPAELLKVSW